MSLSASKRERIAKRERIREVNVRSLNGRGYWMDANHEAYARSYIETGNPDHLSRLPDYRIYHNG